MTEKQFEDIEKKLNEIIESNAKIKKLLDEMYPYKTREELVEIGKHTDLIRKV